jgi:2-hydroxy-6-oxonona-2,4-dienedioate hydrolase
LHQITADTLVVWGREDRLVPLRHAEILNASIPRSRLVVIDGAGHTPMGEKRESFQRLVHDFLASN